LTTAAPTTSAVPERTAWCARYDAEALDSFIAARNDAAEVYDLARDAAADSYTVKAANAAAAAIRAATDLTAAAAAAREEFDADGALMGETREDFDIVRVAYTSALAHYDAAHNALGDVYVSLGGIGDAYAARTAFGDAVHAALDAYAAVANARDAYAAYDDAYDAARVGFAGVYTSARAAKIRIARSAHDVASDTFRDVDAAGGALRDAYKVARTALDTSHAAAVTDALTALDDASASLEDTREAARQCETEAASAHSGG